MSDNLTAEHRPGDPDGHGRFVRLDDGDMHVVQDGPPDGPALALIHGTAASAAWWDPVVPALAAACRVIRALTTGSYGLTMVTCMWWRTAARVRPACC